MPIQFTGPLYIATGNKGKLREIEEMVMEYFPQLKEIRGRAARNAAENEKTFTGNALIKARALARELADERASSLFSFAVLADDSGIEVDALGGSPGVLSARYARQGATADENMKKLLTALNKKGVIPEERTARYQCALALIINDKGRVQEWTSQGSCEGLIIEAPEGQGGFGYDPIFYSPRFGKTFAQLSYAEKNSYSHRRMAFDHLKKQFLN